MSEGLDAERRNIDEIDRQLAALFQKRMECVKRVGEIKKLSGEPVFDPERERKMLENELSFVSPDFRGLYRRVLLSLLSSSKEYQQSLLSPEDTLCVFCGGGTYEIKIKRGALGSAEDFFDLQRRVLVVTDDGVPAIYSQAVTSKCDRPVVVTLPSGEGSKSFSAVELLEKTMLENGFTRGDCVVAVGGGVVGDVAGFAASAYMRGIDFYNVPTTLLAQVDSSIGGKTAINLGDTKNTVGSFYQPKAVLIDPNVLKSLDERNLASGLGECIKSALIGDRELLNIIESGEISERIDEIIYRSLYVKKKFVEEDEKESGSRKALNLGHTIGHAIEIQGGLSHGEAVALGILPMVSDEIRQRLTKIYPSLGLSTHFDIPEGIGEMIRRDKKAKDNKIVTVTVYKIGEYSFTCLSVEEIEQRARRVLSK